MFVSCLCNVSPEKPVEPVALSSDSEQEAESSPDTDAESGSNTNVEPVSDTDTDSGSDTDAVSSQCDVDSQPDYSSDE